jgi:GT2 family glycosyltransferase
MSFSILIPTWNNRPYLANCIRSIRQHSTYKHQIIVVVNEGADDTLDWLREQQIQFIHHPQNVGICIGLNSSTQLIKNDVVVYLNDDMYVLPDWDAHLINEIKSIGHNQYMLSGTMIEPFDTGNDCVVIGDYGTDLDSFNEDGLLENFQKPIKQDWNGASWPPIVIPTELWKKVGGMSEEFSPGMYSDPDLSMKLWNAGVRYFKGVSNSRVYHFGSKSTAKLGKNIGRKLFLQKWGISSRYFYKNYLKMGTPWSGKLPDFKPTLSSKILHWFKQR